MSVATPSVEWTGHDDTAGRSRWLRILRGRETDPRWARPCLLALLAATAILYLLRPEKPWPWVW